VFHSILWQSWKQSHETDPETSLIRRNMVGLDFELVGRVRFKLQWTLTSSKSSTGGLSYLVCSSYQILLITACVFGTALTTGISWFN